MRELFGALPADYPAAVFVVMHLAPESPSVLPDILDHISALPVRLAEDAEYPDMPRNALAVVEADYRIPPREMASALLDLARQRVVASEEPAPPGMANEVRMTVQNQSSMDQLDGMGRRVPLTCPECGGALWEVDNGGPRFRCHVGHAYPLQTLAADQSVQVEAALWAGLRKLEESERLARRMEAHARANGSRRSADYHADLARSSASHAETLRNLLAERVGLAEDTAANE